MLESIDARKKIIMYIQKEDNHSRACCMDERTEGIVMEETRAKCNGSENTLILTAIIVRTGKKLGCFSVIFVVISILHRTRHDRPRGAEIEHAK